MLKIVQDVAAFHRAGEVASPSKPGFPSEDRVSLRKKLIEEEVGETLRAIEEKNLVEVADGIADSIVVLVGTALEFGIDLTAVWNEVHRSNMSKFPECDRCFGDGWWQPERERETCPTCGGRGTLLLRREDGKILKPPSWSPPDISGILKR
jgi:predicted HAD superfamily Cof-like phosphohydrolase